MPTVLCFGDSLTWGSRPDGQGRHRWDVRWPTALAQGLDGVEVIAEGLRGRTTAHETGDNPGNPNGTAILPTLLHSHAPLDVVVILLGLNDIYFGFGPDRAARGLRRLVEQIQGHPWRIADAQAPGILLLAPPRIVPAPGITPQMVAGSHALTDAVRTVAELCGTAFFDAGSVAECDPGDGIHLDAENTRAIGASLVDPVRSLLN